MKPICVILTAAVLVAGATASRGQTINWHNAVLDDVRDSNGTPWDSGFTIELGTFSGTFTPAEGNVNDWLANWLVFDRADFTPALGYFTGTATMLPNGTSGSPDTTPGAPSFEGKAAYIWVRKGDFAVPMTEWMLVNDPSWVFPPANQACCGNGVPLEWAISDLEPTDVPKWGGQGGIPGPGVVPSPGPYPLQTHTFSAEPVPEPALGSLIAMTAVLALTRRRRGGS